MRLIHTFDTPELATAFGNYLQKHAVVAKVEISVQQFPDEVVGQVWVVDEEQLQKALTLLEEFQKSPQADLEGYASKPSFIKQEEVVPPNTSKLKLKRRRAFGEVTLLTIFICIFLFIWGISQVKPVKNFPKAMRLSPLIASPIYEALLFDYPPMLQILQQFYDALADSGDDPNFIKSPKAQSLIRMYNRAPYWAGIYNTYLLPNQNTDHTSGVLFEKIRQGEIWRLFTPALLHANFLHLFFNLIWFAILGNQIEKRIGVIKYVAFILITGIIANLCQYLMTGASFMGISGVIAAMAGFIWMRQSKAAWEGYTVQRITLLFLAFYILAMLVIQIVSYIAQLKGHQMFMTNLANTAHIVGAISGIILGNMNVFSAWNMGQIKK